VAHVVTEPPEPFLVAGGRLEVHCVPAAQDNLAWVLRCVQTGTTAVIDAPSATEVQQYLQARGWKLDAIWNTHTHGDHVGINRDLLGKGGLPPVVVGPSGARDEVPGLTRAVDEGDEVMLGEVRARVMRTDGHLYGHVSYVFDGAIFCGDTLFTGGCGRLLGGTAEQLFDSLCRLCELPGDTLVCCAHEYTQDNLRFAWSVEPGNELLRRRIEGVWARRARGACVVPSALELERATNPFLRPGSPEILRAVPEIDRRSPLAVFAALRGLKDRGEYRKNPDPIGSAIE
jgi:hydroxyacylglutathione hydrolase